MPETRAPSAPSSPPAQYPVRLSGALDEGLSRWRWLVKWFLAIPHFVALAFLWLGLVIVTVVAGVNILFTGRYPRRLFAYSTGVLRWTWRVTFYAFTLGTDRYPPFSLAPDPGYPASLEIPYPEQLSRSLVLVKWWLLAIPHYIIVAAFGAGSGAGLLCILALVAGVSLAVKGAYPTTVFDFIMGMERWSYRVIAYGALLRDEYPPFRLDTGGPDPVAAPASGGTFPSPPATAGGRPAPAPAL